MKLQRGETIEDRQEKVVRAGDKLIRLEMRAKELQELINRREKRNLERQGLIDRGNQRNQRDKKRVQYLQGEIDWERDNVKDLKTFKDTTVFVEV